MAENEPLENGRQLMENGRQTWGDMENCRQSSRLCIIDGQGGWLSHTDLIHKTQKQKKKVHKFHFAPYNAEFVSYQYFTPYNADFVSYRPFYPIKRRIWIIQTILHHKMQILLHTSISLHKMHNLPHTDNFTP